MRDRSLEAMLAQLCEMNKGSAPCAGIYVENGKYHSYGGMQSGSGDTVREAVAEHLRVQLEIRKGNDD